MPHYSLPTTHYPLLIIVGPTSSGKSELAVSLAKRFNGEIISADSRQIYRGMDLGTGKIEGKWCVGKKCGRTFCLHYVYKGVVHHCIDYINPRLQYSASLFQQDAKKAIADILARGKLPILCGGTAHWIDAVVYDQIIPNVKPNLKLRTKLEKQSADALFKKLTKFDPVRAKNIDRFNKRRLIRALEIIAATGKPVPQLLTAHYSLPTYDTLWIGIKPADEILHSKIKKRLKQRLEQGMINEVRHLHSPPKIGGVSREARRGGISWRKLESFGLEYKFVSLYLQKKLTYEQMFEQLFTAIKQYSKRQRTWWKRNKEIKWIKKPEQAKKFTKSFLQAA